MIVYVYINQEVKIVIGIISGHVQYTVFDNTFVWKTTDNWHALNSFGAEIRQGYNSSQ